LKLLHLTSISFLTVQQMDQHVLIKS